MSTTRGLKQVVNGSQEEKPGTATMSANSFMHDNCSTEPPVNIGGSQRSPTCYTTKDSELSKRVQQIQRAGPAFQPVTTSESVKGQMAERMPVFDPERPYTSLIGLNGSFMLPMQTSGKISPVEAKLLIDNSCARSKRIKREYQKGGTTRMFEPEPVFNPERPYTSLIGLNGSFALPMRAEGKTATVEVDPSVDRFPGRLRQLEDIP